ERRQRAHATRSRGLPANRPREIGCARTAHPGGWPGPPPHLALANRPATPQGGGRTAGACQRLSNSNEQLEGLVTATVEVLLGEAVLVVAGDQIYSVGLDVGEVEHRDGANQTTEGRSREVLRLRHLAAMAQCEVGIAALIHQEHECDNHVSLFGGDAVDLVRAIAKLFLSRGDGPLELAGPFFELGLGAVAADQIPIAVLERRHLLVEHRREPLPEDALLCNGLLLRRLRDDLVQTTSKRIGGEEPDHHLDSEEGFAHQLLPDPPALPKEPLRPERTPGMAAVDFDARTETNARPEGFCLPIPAAPPKVREEKMVGLGVG